jgi:hypothetical protein
MSARTAFVLTLILRWLRLENTRGAGGARLLVLKQEGCAEGDGARERRAPLSVSSVALRLLTQLSSSLSLSLSLSAVIRSTTVIGPVRFVKAKCKHSLRFLQVAAAAVDRHHRRPLQLRL